MLPTSGHSAHSFQVRRTFQGHDVIGESKEGFLVLANGKKVTPSFGMERGSVDLSDPNALKECGIIRHASPAPTRASAGASAPASLADSASGRAGPATTEVPHFGKRTEPSPTLSGARELADRMNTDHRQPKEVLEDLRKARAHFGDLFKDRQQTGDPEDTLFVRCVKPILNSMNARSPGLDAIGCTHEDQMAAVLRRLSGGNQEGHVRFHLGMVVNVHSLAVDAYRHADGKFTLIAIDSISKDITLSKMAEIRRKHPDLIKGTMVLPTPNQAHTEGCRVFAATSLEAMRDYQPHMLDLHKAIEAKVEGKAARLPSPAAWKNTDNHTLALNDPLDAFGVLAGKFFKHMQVLKPKPGETGDLLDAAEARNPALKTEAQNKKEQSLRARIEGRNAEKAIADFERFDRTSSVDGKRLVLLDRAIGYYAAKIAD